MPFYAEWQERGAYDECWSCWEAINEVIHEVATEHNIPVAPVYSTFNGPDHDQDAMDSGYVETEGSDRNAGSVNEAGRDVIADLLQELGYEPNIP